MFHLPINLVNRILSKPDMDMTEKLRLAGKLFPEILKAFVRGIPNYPKELMLKPQLSGTEALQYFTTAPFTSMMEEVGEVLKKPAYEGSTWAELIFGRKQVDDILGAYIYQEGLLARPGFLGSGAGKWVDRLSSFFVANYVPTFLALRSIWHSFVPFFYGRWAKGLATALATGTVFALYGSIIGLSNVPPFSLIDNFLKVGNHLGLFISRNFPDDEAHPLYPIVTSLMHNNLINKAFGDEGMKALVHTFIGSGLAGYFTHLRTKAGALDFPPILDAPIIQIGSSLMQNYKFLTERLQKGELKLKDYYYILQQSILRNSGVITRAQNLLLDRINSVAYEPPPEFHKALKEFFLPRETTLGAPYTFSLINEKTVKETREGGLRSYQYFWGTLARALEKKGFITTVDKELSEALKREQKALIEGVRTGKSFMDETQYQDRIKNYFFLKIFESEILNKDLNYQNVLDELKGMGYSLQSPAWEGYFNDIKDTMRIAKNLAF